MGKIKLAISSLFSQQGLTDTQIKEFVIDEQFGYTTFHILETKKRLRVENGVANNFLRWVNRCFP